MQTGTHCILWQNSNSALIAICLKLWRCYSDLDYWIKCQSKPVVFIQMKIPEGTSKCSNCNAHHTFRHAVYVFTLLYICGLCFLSSLGHSVHLSLVHSNPRQIKPSQANLFQSSPFQLRPSQIYEKCHASPCQANLFMSSPSQDKSNQSYRIQSSLVLSNPSPNRDHAVKVSCLYLYNCFRWYGFACFTLPVWPGPFLMNFA